MLRRVIVKFARLVSSRQVATPAWPIASLTDLQKVEFSTSSSLARSKFRHSRFHIPVLHELWRRREEVGPEKPKHRSEFPNWNYDSELFAFSKRLGENWKRETLIEAFTEKAYADAEAERRAQLVTNRPPENQDSDLPVPQTETNVISNIELAKRGEELIQIYVDKFLRHSLPNYPDEGVKAVCEFLTSDDLLGYIGQNLGTSDLILSTEFPPAVTIYANVMKALVGGLERDQRAERAFYFVHDFILTQLSGRDINQFWKIINPIGLLAKMMKKPLEQGGAECPGEPESRIIWQTGVSTPLAAYKVGIYDSINKQFLGQGGGETVLIAEQTAALDALYRLFGTHDAKKPFEFGLEAHKTRLPEKIIHQQ